MEPRRLLPALMVSMLVLLAALIWLYPSTGDFRADNPFWNGLTTFTAGFEASTIKSLDDLPSTPEGTALILIPYSRLTGRELERLRSYVSAGGTLIVLDDYGFGNQVLSYLGLKVRFAGSPLLDPLFNYKNKWLPKVTGFPQVSLTGGVESLVLNHATALRNASEPEVLAWSSRFSFLDLDGDSAWDPGEPTGPLPVAAYTRVGGGCVVAVADPSIIINGMISLGDNMAFMKSVLGLRGGRLKLLIDQSHLPAGRLEEAKEAVSRAYAAASSPMGTLSLIALMLALALHPIWRRGRVGGS